MQSTIRHRRLRKVLTDAQEADNLKRYQSATATITGRFTREQTVTDGKHLYRVITHGIPFHEDATDLTYGVQRIRATREWSATESLRNTVQFVIRKGIHEPGSRRANRKRTKELPTSYVADFTWRDIKPGSLAMPVTLSVHGTCARVVQPVGDDAPVIAWIDDAKLCELIRANATIAPTPPEVPVVQIQRRSRGPVVQIRPPSRSKCT